MYLSSLFFIYLVILFSGLNNSCTSSDLLINHLQDTVDTYKGSKVIIEEAKKRGKEQRIKSKTPKKKKKKKKSHGRSLKKKKLKPKPVKKKSKGFSLFGKI